MSYFINLSAPPFLQAGRFCISALWHPTCFMVNNTARALCLQRMGGVFNSIGIVRHPVQLQATGAAITCCRHLSLN